MIIIVQNAEDISFIAWIASLPFVFIARENMNAEKEKTLNEFDKGVSIDRLNRVFFLGCRMGRISYDRHTFILQRYSYQRVRRHDAYGFSKLFFEWLRDIGCKIIILAIDGRNIYKTTMENFEKNAIIDKLDPQQADHTFLEINKFKVIS